MKENSAKQTAVVVDTMTLARWRPVKHWTLLDIHLSLHTYTFSMAFSRGINIPVVVINATVRSSCGVARMQEYTAHARTCTLVWLACPGHALSKLVQRTEQRKAQKAESEEEEQVMHSLRHTVPCPFAAVCFVCHH